MSLKTITVLRRARKLIADPKSWIKGAFTRKRRGVQCYCGLGALAIAAGLKVKSSQFIDDSPAPAEYLEAHSLLNKASGVNFWFPSFNDRESVTHEDVLKAFDTAIELSKG
jgi:hypothetical protein